MNTRKGWRRLVETAQPAFGKAAAKSDSLGSLFGRPENQSRQVAELQELLSTWRGNGNGNLVHVSHGSTILPLTGVSRSRLKW